MNLGRQGLASRRHGRHSVEQETRAVQRIADNTSNNTGASLALHLLKLLNGLAAHLVQLRCRSKQRACDVERYIRQFISCISKAAELLAQQIKREPPVLSGA